MILTCSPKKKIPIHNQEYLYFGGTNYLGISTNKTFIKNLTEGLKIWGSSHGSSRLANIQLSIYNEVENILASKIQAEKSLLLSSGTLAGKLVTSSLKNPTVVFYHYPKTHPAILTEGSMPLFINAEKELHPNLTSSKDEEIVILLDGVSILEVNIPKFDFLKKISKNKKITLVIDESHSLGVLGKKGEGIFTKVPNENLHRKIMISSLNKSFGIPAGLIASDTKFINSLLHHPLFAASSGVIPAYLEAFKRSQNLYIKQLQRLRENLKFLCTGAEFKTILKYNSNYPLIYPKSEGLKTYLFQNKMLITHFKYPTPKTTLSRIVINANHTKKDLVALKKVLHSFKTQIAL